MILSDADFRREIKKEPKCGYLFFGEEDYLKNYAIEEAEKAIVTDETCRVFNEFRLDGLDFTPDKLLDAMMPMPMMADKKIIVVSGLDFNAMKPSDLDDLCDVLAKLSEYDYNLVIIRVAADALNVGFLPKKPSAVFTKLSEYLTPVQFSACTTAKLALWVGRHFENHGITVSQALCSFIPEYCGHSMFILANEIDKLCFYLLSHGKKEADESDVRKICTSAVEYDAFAFANAVMENRSEDAFAILSDYEFRRLDPLMIFSDVSRVICDMVAVKSLSADGIPTSEISSLTKIHEFKVSMYQKTLRAVSSEKLYRMLDACSEADAALKMSPKGYEILENLICRLSI